jgi:hypothetical protein
VQDSFAERTRSDSTPFLSKFDLVQRGVCSVLSTLYLVWYELREGSMNDTAVFTMSDIRLNPSCSLALSLSGDACRGCSYALLIGTDEDDGIDFIQ